jgi:hypothetical protein
VLADELAIVIGVVVVIYFHDSLRSVKTLYHSDITTMQCTISLKIEMPEEFADYLTAKNINNNLIFAATKTHKAEQYVCQSAKCLGWTETNRQPCAGGN